VALEERLRLIVDATTGTAEANFGKLTNEAERTATAVDTAANNVASAADRVALARNKEADAAGKLAIAERKLEEVRDRYGEGSSQLVAAEERVASAQRGVQLAARNTAQALEAQEEAQRDATDAADAGATASDNAGRGAERFREEVDGLKGTVVGLVAGVSLADWVSESVSGFLEGARGASALAIGMNSTVEEGGRFLAVAQQLGLEMGDLVEIQASFAQVVGGDAEALSSFGAEVKVNADGTTNWALTLQDALAHLQRIPDATKRNETGFRLFGEEGYKQMNALLVSGRSVDEVFEAMGTPFDEDDVQAARDYDAAMADLSSTGGSVSRELGSVLVPILTGMLEAFGALVDVVTGVPAPLGLAAVAAVVLGLANRATAESGGLLAASLAAAQGAASRFSAAAVAAAGSSGVAAAAMGGMRVAGAGMATVLGGPLGIALLAVGAGFAILNSLTGDNEAQAEATARAQETLTTALRESNGVVTDAVRQQAALAAQEAGVLTSAERAGVSRGDVTKAVLEGGEAYDRVREKLLAYADAQTTTVQDAEGYVTSSITAQGQAARDSADALAELRGSTEDTADEQQQLAGELDESTDKAALATAAVDALTGALEAGGVSTSTLSRLAGEAADAQAAEAESTDRAKAAIEAHNAVTRDAVAAIRERIDATYAAESAEFRFLDAMDAANEATDDGTTSVDEQREAQVALMTAALAAGDAAGDAAVEARQAAGDVLTDVDEANVRAGAMLDNLRGKLNTPGLSKGARDEMQGLIDQLVTAQENGDIEAVLRLTGGPKTASEIDEAAEDRETTVEVESRGGPAVKGYLDGIANARRLAIVNVESRGGPPVLDYLRGLAVADRLALIHVESRGGPAVDDYLDGLASQYRLALIHVETRGGPAVREYLDDLAGNYGQGRSATINVGRGAPVAGAYGAPSLVGAQIGPAMIVNATLDLELRGSIDRQQLSKAERGRARVEEIRAYEQRNGTGWRRRP